MIELQGDGFLLRPWRDGDQAALVQHANSRAIWENLGNGFPHPYTPLAADWWIDDCACAPESDVRLAIEIDGEAAGGIGLERLCLLSPHTYRIGYWLGEAFWGRGIVTAAVQLLTDYAFDEMNARRIEAQVYEWNPSSRRVLEKCGYDFEGTMRQAVYKEGFRSGDCHLLARIREP